VRSSEMSRRGVATFAGAVALLASQAVSAQQSDAPTKAKSTIPAEQDSYDVTSLSLEELLNLGIESASKISQRAQEAPSVVSVVTRDQMELFGWTHLNEILFRQPSFFPSQDYERVTVGARGLFESWNSNHLLLLIDGVPYNDNETGGAYTWEITPLFLAKSVEIIRGPGSALYGSNAANGVIAINTLSAHAGFARAWATARHRRSRRPSPEPRPTSARWSASAPSRRSGTSTSRTTPPAGPTPRARCSSFPCATTAPPATSSPSSRGAAP
jgi:outer membrane receptor protein involved in Fe transport